MASKPQSTISENFADNMGCSICGQDALTVNHVETLPDYVTCGECGSAFILEDEGERVLYGEIPEEYEATRRFALKQWAWPEAIARKAMPERPASDPIENVAEATEQDFRQTAILHDEVDELSNLDRTDLDALETAVEAQAEIDLDDRLDSVIGEVPESGAPDNDPVSTEETVDDPAPAFNLDERLESVTDLPTEDVGLESLALDSYEDETETGSDFDIEDRLESVTENPTEDVSLDRPAIPSGEYENEDQSEVRLEDRLNSFADTPPSEDVDLNQRIGLDDQTSLEESVSAVDDSEAEDIARLDALIPDSSDQDIEIGDLFLDPEADDEINSEETAAFTAASMADSGLTPLPGDFSASDMSGAITDSEGDEHSIGDAASTSDDVDPGDFVVDEKSSQAADYAPEEIADHQPLDPLFDSESVPFEDTDSDQTFEGSSDLFLDSLTEIAGETPSQEDLDEYPAPVSFDFAGEPDGSDSPIEAAIPAVGAAAVGEAASDVIDEIPETTDEVPEEAPQPLEPPPDKRYLVVVEGTQIEFPGDQCAHCTLPTRRAHLNVLGTLPDPANLSQRVDETFQIPLCDTCRQRASAKSDEARSGRMQAVLISGLIAMIMVVGGLIAGLVNFEGSLMTDIFILLILGVLGFSISLIFLLNRLGSGAPPADAMFVRTTLAMVERADNFETGFGWRNETYADLFRQSNHTDSTGEVTPMVDQTFSTQQQPSETTEEEPEES